MSLSAAVNPRNNAFAGGTYAPNAPPTAVGGTFTPVGAPGFPNAAAGQIVSARNNRGTNVRIPYARLCPLRAKSEEPHSWAYIPGVKSRDGIVGRPLGNEYDGLETGELAWILGRTSQPMGAHQYPLGFGVDRMQRLCSQFYIENYFRANFASTVINLINLPIVVNSDSKFSTEIASYEQYLTGATVLGSVDVPHLVNGLFKAPAVQELKYAAEGVDPTADGVKATALRGDANQEGFSSGLFVMEKGPFLRGKIVEDSPIEMVAPELLPTVAEGRRKHVVPRNLGDRLAFDALFRAMREQGMFDWSPDGLILSKLESPSGDPLASAELDARQAQLFNVAIQGPAITKTWTGNPLMHAMPLDKVFVVIVADVSSTVSDTATDGVGVGEDMKEMWEAYHDIYASVQGKGDATAYNDKKKNIFTTQNTKITANKDAIGAYALAWTGFVKKSKEAGIDPKSADLRTAAEEARSALKEFTDGTIDFEEFDRVAVAVKKGIKGISTSSMTNFRLMRCTSSFLSNTSAVRKEGNRIHPSSRCGLKIGKNGLTYTAEYIIGGWCVGTVLDSAASRSVTHQQIRTAPASMAMNVNVNVEWMSGDDL